MKITSINAITKRKLQNNQKKHLKNSKVKEIKNSKTLQVKSRRKMNKLIFLSKK